MTKKFELIRRTVITTLLIGITLSMAVMFYSCSDDDGGTKEPETLAGTYKMSQVIVTQEYKIGELTIFDAGEDVTALASQGILAAAPCNNAANAAVDLRDTGGLFLVCEGETGELQAGTWTENAGLTTLSLNLSSPPFPQNLQLSVMNITQTANTITGDINSLVLPADLLPEIPGIEFPPAVILAVQVTFVEI